MKLKRIVILISVFLIAFYGFSKTKQSDESRFQLGFGVMVSTSNLYMG